MDLMGLCSICGKPGVMRTCHLCGKNVCQNCYDSMHDVCNRCKRGNPPF